MSVSGTRRSTVLAGLAAILSLAVLVRPGQARQDQVPAATIDLVSAYYEARALGWDFLPGRAIVKFKTGTTAQGRQRALSALRGRPQANDLTWIGDRAIVRDETERDARILAQRLREQPEVESAELDYIQRPAEVRGKRALRLEDADRPSGVPNDPQYNTFQWNFMQLEMPRVWDINPGASNSVIVAVVDTGVTTVTETRTYPLWTGSRIEQVPMAFDVNPDLPASRLLPGRDFVFSQGGIPVLDMDGHASHVSATIAEETNNSVRLAGIAYHARILPVKVCIGYWELMIINAQAGRGGFLVDPDDGMCPTSAVAAGIRYAVDNGAKVINISLGGEGAVPLERDAIAYAVAQGAFVSISAGNEYEDGNPIGYPAFYASTIDGAMSVGATGKSQTRSYFSSTGSWVEIAAPGGNDRDPGSGDDDGYIWQAALLYTDSLAPSVTRPRFDRYASIGSEGTSMAAPHVAGLAALLVSQGITSPKAIEAIIKGSAKDLGTAGKDDQFGYGLIQPRAALFGRGVRR